jgi:hypothetical protein
LKTTIFTFFIMIFGAVSCGPRADKPVATVDPARIEEARTAFIQPTFPPASSPSPTPVLEYEAAISRTVARMRRDILAGDVTAYFEHVSHKDPVFLREHHAWAERLSDLSLVRFSMRLSSVQIVDDQTTDARLTIEWAYREPGQFGLRTDGTTMTVRFVKSQEATNQWLFAGEAWQTVRLFKAGTRWITIWPGDAEPAKAVERIRLYYLTEHGRGVRGTYTQAIELASALPDMFDVITEDLALAPQDVLHIKLYDHVRNLRAMTAIDLPRTVRHWNQPGQALKIATDGLSGDLPDVRDIAGHIGEALLYQLADTEQDVITTRWLAQGAGCLIAGRHFGSEAWITVQLNMAANAFINDNIRCQNASFNDDASFMLLGHVLLMSIDDVYGTDLRNQWLHEIMSGNSLAAATESVLGISFSELERNRRIWLVEHVPTLR